MKLTFSYIYTHSYECKVLPETVKVNLQNKSHLHQGTSFAAEVAQPAKP